MNTKAAEQFKAYDTAMINHYFCGAPEPNPTDYGYLHGWIIVDGQSFNREMATGEQYDANQGGWTWV